LVGSEMCTRDSYDGTSMGLVHRDIKPANLFVTYDGQTKVLDFGVAKATAPGQDATNSHVLKGTARYMAPEAVGGGDIDARADVFSVGVVLWELASGRPLWQGVEELQVIRRLMDNDVPTLDSEDVDAPPELSRICAKALQLDPKLRYPTAEALRQDLVAFVADQGLSDVGGALRMVMEVEFGHRRKLRATSIQERLQGLKEASVVDTDDVRTLPSASTSLPSGSSDVGPVSSVTASTGQTGASPGSMRTVVLAAVVSLCVGALGVWWWSPGRGGESGSQVRPEAAAVAPAAATPESSAPATAVAEPELVEVAEVEPSVEPVPAVAVDSREPADIPTRRPRTKTRTRRSPKTSERGPKPAAAAPERPADTPMQPGEMPTKKDKKTSGLSLDKDSPWGDRP
ncbi:MAG: serine/threonine protein kinase, partial [Nannocystaceae bacterium]|nr:serine/threonine protein kinase [Nannocystaceae bacterium]